MFELIVNPIVIRRVAPDCAQGPVLAGAHSPLAKAKNRIRGPASAGAERLAGFLGFPRARGDAFPIGFSLYRSVRPRHNDGFVATPNRIGSEEIQRAIQQLAAAIARRHDATPPVLLGIANGGIVLARRLAAALHRAPCGVIDISFHRDDFGRNPIPKEFAPTQIPVDVSGATVVLVDDVLFSGRTVKAALDELFDHGRPARVELAVLVDRGGRRLPVAADYCGLPLAAGEAERVSVCLDPRDSANDAIVVLPAEAASTPPAADRPG